MEKRNWKIYYTEYAGPQKRAVDLLYRELGKHVLRDNGRYSFHTIACQTGEIDCESHAVVLGIYGQCPLLEAHITKEELPENGYVVKVMDNPQNPQYKLVLLCGSSAVEVLYAAVDFVDDYVALATPSVDAFIHLRNELFEHPLPDYYHATAPDFKTRSIFTWGHPINDYADYFANMARLKLNQVIIWNDFLPLNADDIVECAHSYGIEVMWGFAWGWGFDCRKTDLSDLTALKEQIVEEYNRTYKHVKGDGIYFQSFTEINEDTIGGVRVSEAVTQLVNMTAAALLKDDPHLKLQFGLHATSVKDHLDDIKQVDPRVEIVWEDCGKFPFKSFSGEFNEYKTPEAFAAHYDFTDRILTLRDRAASGIVYKSMLTMDWSRGRVTHQKGPYVMGDMAPETVQQDAQLLEKIWRFYSAEWIEHGQLAQTLTRHIYAKTDGNVNMCLAGMFAGGIWFPTALLAQLFWNCREDYAVTRKRVLYRDWVKF